MMYFSNLIDFEGEVVRSWFKSIKDISLGYWFLFNAWEPEVWDSKGDSRVLREDWDSHRLHIYYVRSLLCVGCTRHCYEKGFAH